MKMHEKKYFIFSPLILEIVFDDGLKPKSVYRKIMFFEDLLYLSHCGFCAEVSEVFCAEAR